jgi:hypothetical protein
MLSLFFAPINPLWHAVPWFGHLTRELNAISGLCGEGNLALCLIETGLGRPVEPLSLRIHR